MENLLGYIRGISPWILGPIVLAVWVAGLLGVKKLVFSRVRAVAGRTRSELDDVLIHSLSLPVSIVIVGSGMLVLERILPLIASLDRGFDLAFAVTCLVAAVLFFDKLVRELIGYYSPRYEFLQTSRGILVGLTRAVIIGSALMVFLDSIGVSITPLIASLGLGSLAVALALKDTLANFFAGIQVLADRPVAVGNFVKLDSGEEGYVTKIGWRSTQVRMLSNNLVVVPNARLIDSVITNYSLPEQELSVLVQVGVHYDSDLEMVERVVCEVGKEVMQTVKGGIPESEPFIRYHTFGDSSINFTVILRAREFVDNYLIKHEFVKALHRRFRKEDIVIPFPIRTLDVRKEDLRLLSGKKGDASE